VHGYHHPVHVEREPERELAACEAGDAPRSEEQEVASGQVDETPAMVLFGVVMTIGAVAGLVVALAAIVYWIA